MLQRRNVLPVFRETGTWMKKRREPYKMGDHAMMDKEKYLEPTFTIDSDHPKIRETALRVTEGCPDDPSRASRLFYFVRDSIPYSVYMISVFQEDFIASRILDWGKGYCVQKAVLLTALGRAAGIPSRLVFAKIRNHRVPAHVAERFGTVFPRHGYNQFFLGGRWISAAATFDKALCEKNDLHVVDFDGRKDAALPEKDRQGNPFIEYLEKFPPRADLPFDWIAEKLKKRVGPDKRPWLTKEDEYPS
jgi:transglutaminase-like putative cysteine protease